jgi:hypothetical protein
MVRRIVALGIALVGVPLVAAAQSLDDYALAMRTLRPGDVVDIREWDGRALRGRLADLTACSLTVATEDGRIAIPVSRLKTLKRIRRAEPTANRLADAGRNCENPGCMAATLVFAGTTAVTRGVQQIFKPSETVYRASDRTARPVQCAVDEIQQTSPRSR